MKKLLLSCMAFAAVSSAMAITIDDLAGFYTETYSITGDDYYVYSATNESDTVTIVKTSDYTVTIAGIISSAEEFEGIVDLEAGTITLAPQPFYTWYTLSASTGESDPVVIKIEEDGSLTITDAACWYGGYVYGSNITSKMVKYADSDITVGFAVECNVNVYKTDDWSVMYSGVSTLTKYESAENSYYVLNNYDGVNTVIKFYVDADGQVITNGVDWSGWGVFYYPYWLGNYDDFVAFNPADSELEYATAESGSIILGGWYYSSYSDMEADNFGYYLYLTWDEEQDIQSVKSETKAGMTYNLNGQKVDAAKGLMIRDGKAIFVK